MIKNLFFFFFCGIASAAAIPDLRYQNNLEMFFLQTVKKRAVLVHETLEALLTMLWEHLKWYYFYTSTFYIADASLL